MDKVEGGNAREASNAPRKAAQAQQSWLWISASEILGILERTLSSAKIQSRHRIDHFEEPTLPGLGPDIAGVPRAVATLLVRAAV
jgi:hypothetical protein